MKKELVEKIEALQKKNQIITKAKEQIDEMKEFLEGLDGQTIYLGYNSYLNEMNRCELSPEES